MSRVIHFEIPATDPERAAAYDVLYAEYLRLHDYFGRGANEVLHRLREIRIQALLTGEAA